MKTLITYVGFKGDEYLNGIVKSIEITEYTETIKVCCTVVLFAEESIDEQRENIRNALSKVTDITFGVTGLIKDILYYKNLKHIYTDDIGLSIGTQEPLDFKVMAVFRNKE